MRSMTVSPAIAWTASMAMGAEPIVIVGAGGAALAYARAHLVEHHEDAFTIWYLDEEVDVVGVLTHDCDTDYERGRRLIACGGVHA